MKSIKHHILEKLKIGSNAHTYSGEYMNDFEDLIKTLQIYVNHV